MRCYTCAKYTAGGTGLYCGLCFEERHPWYRVAHVSMALSDTRDATLGWESHVRSAQGEQLLREFASLLALTTQFKGEVRAMGAQIDGEGTSRIEIQGVDRLGGATHPVVTDRIELGTYMLAPVFTGGEIECIGGRMHLVESFAAKLDAAGIDVSETRMA